MMNLGQFYKPLPDIGLFGKMRSGKDEVFKIIDRMGFDVERVAFGDAMKERFFETFPNIPRDPKPVELFQKYGQAMREIDPDVWVRPTINRKKHRVCTLSNTGLRVPTFVYTDIRQPNEYQAVKDFGAFMVKVESPLGLRFKRMLELGEKVKLDVLMAPTELHIDNFEADYVIYNDGTTENLKKQVTEMIYKIQSKRNDVQ